MFNAFVPRWGEAMAKKKDAIPTPLKLRKRPLVDLTEPVLEDIVGGRRSDFGICYRSDRFTQCATDCRGKCLGVSDNCWTGPGCGPGRRPSVDCRGTAGC